MEPLYCKTSWHKGKRRVFKTRMFFYGGKRFEGCVPCVGGIVPSAYSTEKRTRLNPSTGKAFSISPAHVRNIKLRKLAPDGRTVYQNRRGNVT